MAIPIEVTYLEFLLDGDRKAIAVTKQIDETAQHWFGRERQTLTANQSRNIIKYEKMQRIHAVCVISWNVVYAHLSVNMTQFESKLCKLA